MTPLYNPNQYRIECGKKYKEQFEYNKKYRLQEIMLIDYLKNISAFSSVIEIGCGFGRITKLLLSHFPDIEEYVAVDISLLKSKTPKSMSNKQVSEIQIYNLSYQISDYSRSTRNMI